MSASCSVCLCMEAISIGYSAEILPLRGMAEQFRKDNRTLANSSIIVSCLSHWRFDKNSLNAKDGFVPGYKYTLETFKTIQNQPLSFTRMDSRTTLIITLFSPCHKMHKREYSYSYLSKHYNGTLQMWLKLLFPHTLLPKLKCLWLITTTFLLALIKSTMRGKSRERNINFKLKKY